MIRRQTTPILNGHRISTDFTKRDMQMDNGHMKRFSTSLVIRKMQMRKAQRASSQHPLKSKIKEAGTGVLARK